MNRQPISLTFDIEDWTHPELVREHVAPNELRTVVREGTEAILEVLERHNARGTFFILGDVARRFPDLVHRIARAGHEIGSHGYSHTPLWRLNPESFRAELRSARAAIKEALNEDPVRGFRAPSFSLDRSTAWALGVLAEEGFEYDSSIFPMKVKMYGISGVPLGIYRPAADDLRRHDPDGRLIEFPVVVRQIGSFRLPIAGGFYLRVLPFGLIETSLDAVLKRRPASVFLHPWECVADLPRVNLSAVARFITYINVRGVLAKLERLAARYSVRPMIEILEDVGQLRRAA
jgi:polysaccharide deacetylase family protein (PEP-CTERM system associated)